MRVCIFGSSGLIGTAFCHALNKRGDQVVHVLRRSSEKVDSAIYWDPMQCRIHASDLEGFDAIVNLAGENIASGKWTDEKKKKIYKSRIEGTYVIAKALQQVSNKPKVFLCASAVGYYGDQGDTILDEQSSAGHTFLARVCKEWEEAALSASPLGIRIVTPRFGIVLSKKGGALSSMLTPFKLGLGGRIGSGEQYMSWIALDDLVQVLLYLLDSSLEGPVNAVTSNPVTNAEFAKTLAEVLYRPAVLPLPAFAARFAFGEMADEMLLASARVLPKKLEEANFSFKHPDLKEAFASIL